jgi:PAS domain S-box-containing protein
MRIPPPLLVAARWLMALAAPAAAAGLMLLLQPLVDQVPTPPFVAAVLVVAWVSGFRPALLATAVSAATLNYYFLPPLHEWTVSPPELVWLGVFVSISVPIAWLVANRAQSRARTEASAQQLRLVTDAAPVMICYIDAEARYRFANRPFAERYGVTPEAIVGRRVADVVGAERYRTVEPHLRAALDGRPATFETTGRDAAGTVRDLHAAFVPDLAGTTVRGVVAVITDVSERKRAEDERARLLTIEQARRHEAEAIAELGRVLTQGLDVDSVAQRLAELARGLLGAVTATVYRVDPESGDFVCLAISGNMGPFRVGGVVPREAGVIGAAVRRGGPVTSDNVLTDPALVFPPETRAWVEQASYRAALALPLTLKGRTIGAFALGDRLGRTFTPDEVRLAAAVADHAAVALENARLYTEAEARRREAERRAARARLLADVSRVLASSLDYGKTLDTVAGLVVPDHADGCVVHLARRDGSVRRVGVAHADPAHAGLAEQMRQLPPTPGWLKTGGPIIDALRAGRSIFLPEATPADLERLTGGIEDQPILTSLQPRSLLTVALVARGRTLGAMSWLRIANPERYTADDLRLAEDLAGRIALAIDNARLYRQAQRARVEAEEANRAKDEFLAVLSHELRTPLTSMLGWLRLLRSGQLTGDKAAQALEVVERNTRTQAQLINDLLDVSRIVAGKLQLELYPVDLTPILEEAVELSRTEAEGKDVKLELTVDARASAVLGDPLRLGQIVANLVTNAVKFTSAGGHVRVGLARDGEHAVLTVADTGIGIEPDLLPRIFDRFRQADSTITRRHGGLGLGLAIVRHLAELHAGTVSAESRGRGQGSTFTVRLPLAGHVGRRRRSGLRLGDGDGSGRALAGLRVLVAEDHQDTADLMRAVLESHGATVRTADSLAVALEALARDDVDVLVSDIGMPDGDGYELLRRLGTPEGPHGPATLPAVAVTAFAGPQDRERALAAGFRHFVAKPIEPAALIDAIVRATTVAEPGGEGRPS